MRYNYKLYSLLAFTFILGLLPSLLSAQNNLKVNFKDAASAPRNLVVCGDEATVTVTVSTEGLASAPRQNIQARLNLFKGVELVRFVPTGSTAGVVMTDSSDLGSPVFALPTLTPNALSSVDIQYVVRVNCRYTDSLSINDSLSVVDKWDFLYDLGVAQFGVIESDLSTEYRDQIKVPFFTMSVSNNAPSGARVGQCYQRTTLINNSGLDGWVKGFVYTTSQGPGVSISSISVNGVDYPFTKNPSFNATGDTLIALIIPDSIFKYNTMGLSGPADGDSLFEANETVTIIENICVANCDLSRISTHTMSWGCDARYCNTVTRQDIVKLGQGSVNVGFQSNGSVANTEGGYCTNGTQTVTFTNTGVEVDAGTGSMFDISAGIGLSDSLKDAYAGYRISSVTIAGVSIPVFTNPIIDIKDNPLFTSDPDGAGGLEDIDGDGFYDDLAINESFEITINYEVECSVSLTNKEDYCTNDFETGFGARLDYTDLCQNRTTYFQPRFFSPVNSSDYIQNCVDPDARTDGKVFFIQSTQIRNVFNFERDCNGQEVLQVAIKMPAGVTPVRDSMYMKWFEVDMPLVSYNVSNDTVFMAFDATKAQYLNGEYNSRFAFSADCSATPGASAFPIETAFYCPPCDCRHVWYCDTISGPRIHYSEPPCVPNALYECDNGIRTTNFTVARTTFGYLDDTYTTRLRAEEVNTKVALSCDSVRMTVSNIVGKNAIFDSIGVYISYDNIAKNDSNRLNDIFTFAKGTVNITHGGNTFSCLVDATKMTAIRTDTTKAMRFDLNDCLASMGFGTLDPGDTVTFVGDFTVNPDGPFIYTFEKVPNFRAYGYYIDNDSMYVCDNYGALFDVGKSQALFSYPSSSNFPIGCNEASLEYKITMFNNDFSKHFGNEFRQAVSVDSISLDYDPAFVKAFATKVEISIADHPVVGDAFFPLANLDSTGHFSARFDTLVGVPSLNLLTSYAFNFRIKAVPNCATYTGSSFGDNSFYFKPNIYYRDRYYAKFIGDGSCSPYKRDTAPVASQRVDYNYPATLEFTPITNPSITVANDTAEWTVKLCNTNDKGSATNSWLSIEPTSAGKNFKVIAIKDVTNNLAPINHLVKYYPTDSSKAFAFLSGLAEVTPQKTIDDVCNVVNIKAVVRECGTTNLNFRTGWLCALPTSATWTPTEYAPCADSVIQAQVRTENPFLDGSFINQSVTIKPGICDTTVLEVLLRNTDLGTAYNVKTRLTIPLQGANLLASSIEVAYPSSAAYQAVTGAPTLISQNQRGKTYEFSNFQYLNSFLHSKGLKGFNSSNPNDSNEVKIRFKFTNDCDFKSGSLSYFSFVGETVCGTASNFESGESLPLEIQGATLSTPKSYEVSMGTGNQFVAGGYSTLEVKFKNLLTTLSDSADEVGVKLPAGITYRPGTSVGVFPATWVPTEPRIDVVGDIQILTWHQPLGMVQNEEATLRFDVNASDTLACGGTLDMALATLAAKDLVCTSTASVCKTELITTSNGEHYYAIPLVIDTVDIIADKAIVGNTIHVNAGDSVKLTGFNSQFYQWLDISNGQVLSTDSSFYFVPTKQVTDIYALNGLPSGCILPFIFKVYVDTLPADTVPPTITPTDTLFAGKTNGDTIVSYQCNQPIYFTINSVTVTDSLDANPTVTLDSTILNGNCFIDHYIVQKTYTWTAKDSTGNTRTFTINVQISDNIPPVLVGVPNDIVLSALDPIPSANVTATDNCTFASVTPNSLFLGMDGPDSLLARTWVAIDQCGNISRDTQFIRKRGYGTPSVSERRDTIIIGDSTVYCLSNLGLVGNITSVTNTCPTTSNRNVTYTVNASNCLVMQGEKVGIDTACLTICTDSSYCVQVKFITEVIARKKDTISVIIDIGKSDTVCLNTKGLKGTKFTVTNVCPDSSAAVEYIIKDTCIIIKGMYGGTTKSCWAVCDTTGRCDTTIINITINPSVTNYSDTIFVGDTVKYCLSTLPLKGKITSVVNDCKSLSNRFASLVVDSNNCVVFEGLSAGIDTACFTVCTDSNVCAKVNIYITVQSLPKDTVRVNIEKGASDTVCLRTSGLVGNKFTIKNYCADTTNKSIVYQVLSDSCIIIKGITAGVGTSCWTVCDTLNNCDTTIIFVTVTDTSVIKRKDSILVGDSIKFCLSQLNLKGTITSVVNNCTITSNRNAIYSLDTNNCLVIKGIRLGVDTACIQVCTDSLDCQTIVFETTVLPHHDTVKVNVYTGKSDTVCLTFNRPMKGPLTNICADSTNTSVQYQVLGDSCIVIKGVQQGTSKSCWVICDTLGVCDTVIINTTVTDPSVIQKSDTIHVGDSLKYCLSDLNFKGKITSIVANCTTTSNRNVIYTLDSVTNCITYKGIRIGVDTACYDVCTDSLECKKLILYTAVLPNKDTINVVINVGQKDTICLNLNRPHSKTPIYNACVDSTNTAVQFEVLGDTCVIVKGIEVGTGKSCWVLCDTLGVCDTIVINVSINPNLPPIAVDDSATTRINTPVVIPVMGNDTLNGVFSKITLLTDPKYGAAEWVQDSTGNWSLNYTPKDGFCSSKYIDQFIYQLCNQYGCDQATISVKIICEGIIIYSGMSPNGDGKNDFFTIDGLENFSNTKVLIFNRWGNKVYESDDYKNDWGGIWNSHKVPDGTYFYQVILENGEIYTGFLQIHQ